VCVCVCVCVYVCVCECACVCVCVCVCACVCVLNVGTTRKRQKKMEKNKKRVVPGGEGRAPRIRQGGRNRRKLSEAHTSVKRDLKMSRQKRPGPIIYVHVYMYDIIYLCIIIL